MFAPTLFIGAMLGAAVGTFEKIYFPHLTGSIGSYALVGMGVLFAAFLRAPLTSVFMVLEVSGNYSIVVPVILANTIAYVISRVVQPVPIFEELTHQDGLYLPSMEEAREESSLHLEDAIQPVAVPVLQGSETVSDARRSLAQYKDGETAPAVLVKCNDGLWYAAKREEMEALFSKPTAEVASDLTAANLVALAELSLAERLGPERTPVLFPDLPLSSALPHFQRWPILPISNRARRGSLEGVVTLQDVLNRYQQQRNRSH
jgi:CIC family chloride channel protein